jgi:hypothetical protein
VPARQRCFADLHDGAVALSVVCHGVFVSPAQLLRNKWACGG